MQVTQKSRLQVRIQYYVFVVLFMLAIGLLAWLSNRYSIEADWTANSRNTLSQASITLLQRIDGPVKITAFAADAEVSPARDQIRDIIRRYQKHKPDIELDFVNPETDPQLTRDMGIRLDGELVVEYQGRTEHVQRPNEQTLTNALQRLLRSGERNVVFVTGHGERNPNGNANHDLGDFARNLREKGFTFSTVNLIEKKAIPDDTAVLVIAGPQVNYLPGEVELIKDYLAAGGNLLWLHEPGELKGLAPLAEYLGVSFHRGMIVDPTTQLLRIDNPSFALVTAYPLHPITSDFSFITIFPQAAGVKFRADNGWIVTEFLTTADGSWSETGPLMGSVEYNEGQDVPGPLAIGLAMTRKAPETAPADAPPADAAPADTPEATPAEEDREQRVVVMGDGDFITNAFLGNQGNQDMGQNILNWLSHDDRFIAIPVRAAPDTTLTLSMTGWGVLGLLFLIVLPVALLVTGVTIWLRRRKR